MYTHSLYDNQHTPEVRLARAGLARPGRTARFKTRIDDIDERFFNSAMFIQSAGLWLAGKRRSSFSVSVVRGMSGMWLWNAAHLHRRT